MFQLAINAVSVIFSKFFSKNDEAAVLAALSWAKSGPGEEVWEFSDPPRRVVFIDTPATAGLVRVVESLIGCGIEVVVRDHHDAPARSNPREVQIADAARRIRELVGAKALISDREKNPACSSLLRVGEFVSMLPCPYCNGSGAGDVGVQGCTLCGGTNAVPTRTVIVADPDPDGLTAAMKAAGVVYVGMDADAAILDGPRSAQTAEGGLSPLAVLLVKGLATLPPFDTARPAVSEKAKEGLFGQFVAAASGDEAARAGMESRVAAYDAAVGEARRLGDLAYGPFPGVAFCDTTAARGPYDLSALAQAMEARPGCRVTIVRKSAGPIAAAEKSAGRPAAQISLAVVKTAQAEVNLQAFLPAGFTSAPEAGVISNTTFLLHVSERVWTDIVRPALEAQFAPGPLCGGCGECELCCYGQA